MSRQLRWLATTSMNLLPETFHHTFCVILELVVGCSTLSIETQMVEPEFFFFLRIY